MSDNLATGTSSSPAINSAIKNTMQPVTTSVSQALNNKTSNRTVSVPNSSAGK